ncbi:aldose epimerase family protein [uncultured Victivallis sp.]|uniref:aldose epimerase family protein n=1 Tax=uncultured Victivallis sp. TaxID=354118 RepID=UPI00259AC128|nr:aldose epimerase family protein [uncultured Victivallis sp.]
MVVKDFFKTPDGRTAKLYRLRNSSGFGADITDFGGAVVSIWAPDRDGRMTDVLLGFGNPADYIENGPFFGAVIGRVANRIAGGRFTLDGKEYELALNDSNGKNTLHGGDCWGRRLWKADVIDNTMLALRLTSPDGDAGFPGEVEATLVYMVTEANELILDYTATSDRPTVVSMTNHAYFNLSGESAGNCLDHRVRLRADRRTEVDEFLAPTGSCPPVAGTPYDLNAGKSFRQIFADLPCGFDDNFVLGDVDGVMKRDVAVVSSDTTGIEVRVSTSAPGIQFYMGYFLDGTAVGKNGGGYPQFGAFCLETQLWPDAVHHSEFPSALLEPGRPYKQTTVYQFGIAE